MRARKIGARCPAAVRPAAVRHSGRSIEVTVAAASQPNMWLCGRCLKLTDARAAARCFLFVRVCVSSSVCCSSSCSFCALFCAHAKMFGITHARTVTKPRQRGIEIDGRRACVRECVRACVARRDAATCETPARTHPGQATATATATPPPMKKILFACALRECVHFECLAFGERWWCWWCQRVAPNNFRPILFTFQGPSETARVCVFGCASDAMRGDAAKREAKARVSARSFVCV